MIPVKLQPEPPGFDKDVRRKGRAWLRKNRIRPSSAPPGSSKLPPYWRSCIKQLWDAYSGVCAYLAIYFEYSSGTATTDHFVAKSRNAGDAYEWGNFRLACPGMNSKKHIHDDVLDPVGLARHTFIIDFSTGRIEPNPALSPADRDAAIKTIARLELDSAENNRMRAGHFEYYANGDCSLAFLREKSPFVHEEIMRQGLERKT